MINKQSLVNTSTMTFKLFNHQVTLIQNRTTLWDFTTISGQTQKKYAVCCAPSYRQIKKLIGLAQRKLPQDTRLVVITKDFTEDEFSESVAKNFCLTTFHNIRDYGEQMLNAQHRENLF